MTESEARLLLNVDSSADLEEIIEAYEEAVFEQASFFMRRVFIPKLAKARIRKLEAIGLAAKTVGLDLTECKFDFKFDFTTARSHEAVLEIYNRAETKIKLGLANTSSSAEAKKLFESWVQVFNIYLNSFLSFCDSPDDKVTTKLTEAQIFVEYKNSLPEERLELIRKECARLTRLKD